jgi:hypothetical protein
MANADLATIPGASDLSGGHEAFFPFTSELPLFPPGPRELLNHRGDFLLLLVWGQMIPLGVLGLEVETHKRRILKIGVRCFQCIDHALHMETADQSAPFA